jgi:uncharacterized phiE125 gp8 family phage protein
MNHSRSPYSLQVVTPAASYAVTVDELKTELSISDAAWDAKLALLIREASEQLEVATGRALLVQTFCEFYDWVPLSDAWAMRLHRAPLIAVSSIKYLDTNGAEQTWAANQYTLDIHREPARIALSFTGTLPTVRDVMKCFYVTYTAGYATASVIPSIAKEFIYVYTQARYERRPHMPEEINRLHALINALSFDI